MPPDDYAMGVAAPLLGDALDRDLGMALPRDAAESWAATMRRGSLVNWRANNGNGHWAMMLAGAYAGSDLLARPLGALRANPRQGGDAWESNGTG